MTMSHEDDSGSISPSGRFARMEAALGRIEEKIDRKAEQAALDAVSARVAVIELNGTPKLQAAIASVDALKSHITDLELGRVQSPQTAEYLKVFQQHGADIEELQRQQLVNDTKVATAKETVGAVADARYASMRVMLWVVSIISGAAVLFSSVLTALNVIGAI